MAADKRGKKGKVDTRSFREILEKYLRIKGLDIVVQLEDGTEVELDKNRLLEDNEIVLFAGTPRETRIPLSRVRSVDLYAA